MLALYATVMPIIILFSGLVIDIGILELDKIQLQNAADAAALGAQLEAERGTYNWVAQGQADAAANGFTNGVNNVTVSLQQQPSTGPYAGRYDVIQATVTKSVPTIFMGAFHGGSFTLTAQADALLTPCVYLTGSGTLATYPLDVFTGSLLGNSCPIYVNKSMFDESYGQIAVDATNVAGPASDSNIAGFMYPSANFNSIAMTDPLASLSEPSFSGTCAQTSYSITSGTKTLNPGNYCKSLNISNATVTLNPGLYVITGGATWSHATVNGNGVTLYFTKGGGATSYGQFIMSYCTLNLSAPSTSTNNSIPTVLVYADRDWVHTGARDFQISNTTYTGDGIWYLTNAGIDFYNSGTFTGTNYFGIVADNLYTGGTIVHPTNNYSNVPTGNPFLPAGGLVQ